MMANQFIWHELSTSDLADARAFYTDLVGWTAAGYGGDQSYLQLSAGDRGIGGMMAMPADAAAAGSPLRWSVYVWAADVDDMAAGFKRDGGTVYMPPMDIPGIGRFAIVADPQGAILHLMTPLPRQPQPPVPIGTPGHFGWNELHVPDWESAFAFYAARFGWEKGDAMDMGPMGTYQIFTIDGERAGGMMNSPLPRPMWLSYINVADIDAAHAKILSSGGSVIHGPAEIPGGFIVQAKDRQGVMYAITGPRTA
jgi:uncharacterized protein